MGRPALPIAKKRARNAARQRRWRVKKKVLREQSLTMRPSIDSTAKPNDPMKCLPGSEATIADEENPSNQERHTSSRITLPDQGGNAQANQSIWRWAMQTAPGWLRTSWSRKDHLSSSTSPINDAPKCRHCSARDAK